MMSSLPGAVGILMLVLGMGPEVGSGNFPAKSLFPEAVNYRRIKGKYSVKEEVVRRVERVHPCSLEATAVKVTFPGIKSEVLVSFLGYKEPNLIHVNRCKGYCRQSRMDCVPIRRNMKKIRMHLKTQVIGAAKKRDKVRELILEEHMECGCTCLSSSCPSHTTFSNETCSCACGPSDEETKKLCIGPNHIWDTSSCSCINRDTQESEREEEYEGPFLGELDDDPYTHRLGKVQAKDVSCSHCLECMNSAGISPIYRKKHGGSPLIKSWVLLVFSLILILFLFGSTLHFWRKSQALLKSQRADENYDKIAVGAYLDPGIPLELSEHQINFDHNGDGTMAELFNTSSFFNPPPAAAVAAMGIPPAEGFSNIENFPNGNSSAARVRSSSRHGERKKRKSKERKSKEKRK